MHRLGCRNQDRNARRAVLGRVLSRAPEQAAGLGAVTQRVRTPSENGVARDEVHVPYGKASVSDGTVGKLIEVNLLVQVLTRRKHLDGALSALGAEAVAEVVGGVLLRAGQRTRQHRNLAEECRENYTEITNVTCGDVAYLVTDNEAQRLRVAGLTTDFEQIRVQADVATETMTCRERVDGAVTADNVRIRHTAQTRSLSCFGNHLVRLGELGRGDAHTVHTLLSVENSTPNEDNKRTHKEDGNHLVNCLLQACSGATRIRRVHRFFTRPEEVAHHRAEQVSHRHEQHNVADRSDRVGGDQPRNFGGVTQCVQHLRRQHRLVGEELRLGQGADRLLALVFGKPAGGEVLREGVTGGTECLLAGLGVELPGCWWFSGG